MRKSIEAALVWSTLCPTPLCFYDAHYDAHLCAWNGTLLPQKAALAIVCNTWCNMYQSNSVKESIIDDWQRLSQCGYFKDPGYMPNYHSVLSNFKWHISNGDFTFLEKMKSRYDTRTALGWFDVTNEKTLDDVELYATQQ